MLLKEVIEICDLMDNPKACAASLDEVFAGLDIPPIKVTTLRGEGGQTDVVGVAIPGAKGKSAGGRRPPPWAFWAPLGGLGARPEALGLVSDGDGAFVSLAAALKLARMRTRGDILPGDVLVSTHICPDAPTQPHEPTPFMGSPVGIFEQIRAEIDPAMDAILSVDTTKGNRVINHTGFAISPTVQGMYILKTSNDLLRIQESVTADHPVVFPITTQDITPYGNGLYHLNSIMQPSVLAKVPVVGVAITAKSPVAGCATGAAMPTSLESAARFCVEVAKSFTAGACAFYDPEEYAPDPKALRLDGSPPDRREGLIAAPGRYHRRPIAPPGHHALHDRPAGTGGRGRRGRRPGRTLLRGNWPPWPRPTGESRLATRLKDGTQIVISHHKTLPLVQERVTELNRQGVDLILLLCTGSFPVFESRAPDHRVPNASLTTPWRRLSGRRTPWACSSPWPSRRDHIGRSPKHITPNVAVVSASPYLDPDRLRQAAREMAEHKPDLIVLHCMGYNETHRRIVAEVLNKPSIVANSMVARTLAELLKGQAAIASA